jgi:hypothetical protein
MSFENLSSAQLRQLIGLIRKKESLQAKLDRVDSALRGLGSGGSAVAAAGPGRRKRRRRRRGAAKAAVAKTGRRGPGRKRGGRLKEPLLKALKAAGPSGVKVKDLAAKLKVKPGNIFSWFYTTGKKIKGISKVGEAHYSYTG